MNKQIRLLKMIKDTLVIDHADKPDIYIFRRYAGLLFKVGEKLRMAGDLPHKIEF